ncbi:2-keto-4-pentenoate hydratase/2-oxohepta-3-ene-1,7-dioic acid hydratase in catechol pathway [Saccharopolyspora lacisalsi]|uniref:2-keto-4-pentenoate hydratase/2-oxohepta-3-ene-1,7-dioic acid hydratase in catechol pathway n=1 Tax=Halosaccharopolyspora lacisalsi TaxID=1000566 RepID=A0A839DR98_9PSEU|nr:fumarylacetoacetate hydrolase family protein [Halosaccharopolyspora lacisalsi]MBA8823593.1 2-keto-4-pentenoate hydratase/2-oxohepta-3-ene-1,7-dioic acid hydratase in catechol pathway [Halosaccharopolyspora lacisalsi]
MRVVRYREDGRTSAGVLAGQRLHPVADDALTPGDVARACRTTPEESGTPEELLAPVRPSTVFGMARNTGPGDRATPPRAFLKAAASVSGPGEAIPIPADIGRVDAEAEVAAVVGAPLWRVRPRDVELLGLTVSLDITARRAQQDDPRWTEAKSRRGFTPLGPWIETEADPTDAAITLTRNGATIAEGSTADLARSVTESVSYLSTLVELRPGDVVLTGAPSTFGAIAPGDVVTAAVAGIGALTNPVVAAEDATDREVDHA